MLDSRAPYHLWSPVAWIFPGLPMVPVHSTRHSSFFGPYSRFCVHSVVKPTWTSFIARNCFWMRIVDMRSNRRFQRGYHPNEMPELRLNNKNVALSYNCCTQLRQLQKQWTPSTSVALLDAHRSVPQDAKYNETRKSLRGQITNSLTNDRKQWWIGK